LKDYLLAEKSIFYQRVALLSSHNHRKGGFSNLTKTQSPFRPLSNEDDDEEDEDIADPEHDSNSDDTERTSNNDR
jgi:hypothetical protein